MENVMELVKAPYIGALVNCHVPYGGLVEEFKAIVVDIQGERLYVRPWATEGRQIVLRGQVDVIG